jgi:hypothetical protein
MEIKELPGLLAGVAEVVELMVVRVQHRVLILVLVETMVVVGVITEPLLVIMAQSA